jgi:vacuolar protein sorting-associated protein 13A/C
VYKLLKLDNFAIYCSTTSETFASPQIREMFLSLITKSSVKMTQYIMDPVSGLGKLIWMRKNLNLTQPIYDLNVVFDDLSFNLDDKQYKTFTKAFDTITRQQLAHPYRKFRPPAAISYSLDPLEWFKYAAKCVLSDIHEHKQKWTWKHFKKRRDNRLKYINLYTKLIYIQKSCLTDKEIEEFNQLEWDLCFDDIRLYRHLTVIKMKNEKQAVAKVAQKPTWYGYFNTTTQTEKELLEQKINELYESFKYEDVASSTEYPPDYKQLKLECFLKSGKITLRSFKDTIVDFAFTRFMGLALGFEKFSNIKKINFGIKELLVEEFSRGSFKSIVETITESSGISEFLTGTFTAKNGNGNDSLEMVMLPLKIIMNPGFVTHIAEFFRTEDIIGATKFRTLTTEAIQDYTLQSRAGLLFAISEHKSLNVSIQIAAPLFVFPQDYQSEYSKVIVIDAGKLTINSKLVNRNMEMDKKSIQELVQISYDDFLINFTEMKIYSGEFDDLKIKENAQILESMGIIILIFRYHG